MTDAAGSEAWSYQVDAANKRSIHVNQRTNISTPSNLTKTSTYYLDLAYLTPRRVAVECVGRIGHDFEGAFESDPVRRNRLQLLGWIVIEVTWRRFVNAPQEVVAEVLQALWG